MNKFLAVFLCIGCGGAPKVAPAPKPDVNLAQYVPQKLFRAYWNYTLQASPIWATSLGTRKYDERLDDNTPAARIAHEEKQKQFLLEIQALLAPDRPGRVRMSPQEERDLLLLQERLQNRLATNICQDEKWNVAVFSNGLSRINFVPVAHSLRMSKDVLTLAKRYKQIPNFLKQEQENLKSGVELGLVPSKESLRRALQLVDGELKKPTVKWALVSAVGKGASTYQPTDEEREQLLAIVEGDIKPALVAYRDYLETLSKQARQGEGLSHLPGGRDCYAAKIHSYLGGGISASELHEFGLKELERIRKEMTDLGKSEFNARSFAETIRILRTDKRLYYKSAEEILSDARQSVAAAKSVMGTFFGILPQADCIVEPIPEFEAPFSTVAYYREPSKRSARPGTYFVNTYQPEIRPRYEMKVLSFHEAIPGHHLQIAIAKERTTLPEFRKHGGSTAFVEGWALYTERLADEMGLYETNLDRLGMLSFDAWRASRLVVDTGIHEKKWTRKQAEDFMRKNTALTFANIKNEVDRYIAWPAQALAYKVGQREILRLRASAEKCMGEKFTLKGFHDAVLENGAVSLPVLRRQVTKWMGCTPVK